MPGKKFLFWWSICWLGWCMLWACADFIIGEWPFGIVQVICALIFIYCAKMSSDY